MNKVLGKVPQYKSKMRLKTYLKMQKNHNITVHSNGCSDCAQHTQAINHGNSQTNSAQ